MDANPTPSNNTSQAESPKLPSDMKSTSEQSIVAHLHGPVSPALIKRIIKVQKYSLIAQKGFRYLAAEQKDERNKKILEHMADEEAEHLSYLESISGTKVKASNARFLLFKADTKLFGTTFTCRRMHFHQQFSKSVYAELKEIDPRAETYYQRCLRHESELIDFIDEERLHYVGAIVLGLNDALVEITGALAGVTFSLCNTKIVALTGIVTGISATLSMAASNYLAVKADGTNDALKSGLVTGGSYLAAVILLVLPYLILPDNMYALAFWIMLSEVIIILLCFNYYLAVANHTPFLKRFAQMAVVSLGVALIAFLIGLLAKEVLGITVA